MARPSQGSDAKLQTPEAAASGHRTGPTLTGTKVDAPRVAPEEGPADSDATAGDRTKTETPEATQRGGHGTHGSRLGRHGRVRSPALAGDRTMTDSPEVGGLLAAASPGSARLSSPRGQSPRGTQRPASPRGNSPRGASPDMNAERAFMAGSITIGARLAKAQQNPRWVGRVQAEWQAADPLAVSVTAGERIPRITVSFEAAVAQPRPTVANAPEALEARWPHLQKCTDTIV